MASGCHQDRLFRARPTLDTRETKAQSRTMDIAPDWTDESPLNEPEIDGNQTPSKPVNGADNGHRITPETARAFQQKGVATKLLKRDRLQNLAAGLLAKEAKTPEKPVNSFLARAAKKLRARVKRLDGLLGEEIERRELLVRCPECRQSHTVPLPDSKRIRELSDALSELVETERKLSGRPLPGSLRPKAEPARASRLDEPEPI